MDSSTRNGVSEDAAAIKLRGWDSNPQPFG
jgi:hypothetical protein